MPFPVMAGAARPVAVVVGGLLALQSSPGLDPAKVAFLAVTLIALSGSVLAVWRARGSSLVIAAEPWLLVSILFAAIVGLSFPVALANDTSIGSWLRDAAPYLLVAASPWLALDLGTSMSPRGVTLLLTIVGWITAASFTVTWLQRRGTIDLPFDRVVFPSFVLAAAFFGFAVARSISGRSDRYAWAATAGVVIAMLLWTGTRTTLALTAIPVVLLLDAVRVRGGQMGRAALVPALVPLLVAGMIVLPGVLATLTAPATAGGGLPAAGGAPTNSAVSGPTEDAGRFGTLGAVAAGSDTSLRLRWAQTRAAWDVFLSSPVVGRGPGVPLTWTDGEGTTVSAFTADTPLTVIAKFGVTGFVLWFALGWALMLTLRRLSLAAGASLDARAALLALATGLVALSPFGAQLEDKGTGLAMILLLGLAFSTMRQTTVVTALEPNDA